MAASATAQRGFRAGLVRAPTRLDPEASDPGATDRLILGARDEDCLCNDMLRPPVSLRLYL